MSGSRRTQGGKLRISADGSDGFIADLLSGVNLEADFDVGASWTAGSGIRFTGSHALRSSCPRISILGPIALDALTLTAGVDGGSSRSRSPATSPPSSARSRQRRADRRDHRTGLPGQGGNVGPLDDRARRSSRRRASASRSTRASSRAAAILSSTRKRRVRRRARARRSPTSSASRRSG